MNLVDRGHPDGEESDEGCAKMTVIVEKLQSQLAASDSQILTKSADLDSVSKILLTIRRENSKLCKKKILSLHELIICLV